MYLSEISLYNFKNLTEQNISFSRKINCFGGNNGVGKSNLLDAIYYLSFTKSYFHGNDFISVKHGEDNFSVHGIFQKNSGLPDKVSCIYQPDVKKVFKLNDKQYDRLSEHIGVFPSVMVSPYDRDLINEGSEIRRKFIDMVISQFDKPYLDDLLRYNKLLAHRNKILKQLAETRKKDFEIIHLIDEKMQEPANNITKKRNEFLLHFVDIFQKFYEFISGNREVVNIEYSSSLGEEDYIEASKKSIEKDLQLRHTSIGIHKDDFVFTISNHLAKHTGSQGQQKSFTLALKLGQFEYISNLLGFKPLLLLDDIFDKLDSLRVKKIIDMVNEEKFGQVFITDTDLERLAGLIENTTIVNELFRLQNGKVERHS